MAVFKRERDRAMRSRLHDAEALAYVIVFVYLLRPNRKHGSPFAQKGTESIYLEAVRQI